MKDGIVLDFRQIGCRCVECMNMAHDEMPEHSDQLHVLSHSILIDYEV